MALSDDLKKDVQNTINQTWNVRKGQKVPSSTEVALAGGAVELDATFLYADLASSSKIAKELDRRVAAKILKSFLATAARLVRHNGGSIVSFDGDRILVSLLEIQKTHLLRNVHYRLNMRLQKLYDQNSKQSTSLYVMRLSLYRMA